VREALARRRIFDHDPRAISREDAALSTRHRVAQPAPCAAQERRGVERSRAERRIGGACAGDRMIASMTRPRA
jgi:hypothetical protein